MDTRIENIEAKMAFLEDTVQELNDVVARQDNEIERLQRELKLLNDKLEDLHNQAVIPLPEEKPPPHY